MIRLTVTDSHRNMSGTRRAKLVQFFTEVKSIEAKQALDQVGFCDWYEKEYGVKWFEVVASQNAEVVGYLRCFRNPETATEWFIGDVHVRQAFRGQDIATRMYEKAIDEVKKYQSAEKITTSVNRDNVRSIGLHEKMGFENTGKACTFPNLYFDDKETAFEKWLYSSMPIPDMETAKIVERVLPVWKASKEKLEEAIELTKIGKASLEVIWCGNRLVGTSYEVLSDDVNEYRKQ